MKRDSCGARHDGFVFGVGDILPGVPRSRSDEWMLEPGQEIIRQFAFEAAVTRRARIRDNTFGGTDVLCLDAIIEFHPEQADIVPETLERRSVNAQLQIERMERVWFLSRDDSAAGAREIEIAGGTPARAGAEICFILVPEIVSDSYSPKRRPMVRVDLRCANQL